MAKKLPNVIELAASSGHNCLRMLQRYHPDALQSWVQTAGVRAKEAPVKDPDFLNLLEKMAVFCVNLSLP